jgi:hypothetical protein
MSAQKQTDQSKNSGTGHEDAPRQVTGLVANGSSGPWDIAVDETISGAARWFAQVEGPGVYVYFEIQSPKIIDAIIEFIEIHINVKGGARSDLVAGNGSLDLGGFGCAPVSLVWDDEDKDRCFFTIGTAAQATLRMTLSAGDLAELVGALRQVRDDLEEEGLL